MIDMDINALLKRGRYSHSRIYKSFLNWFIRHYFCCSIHVDTQIADSVLLQHSGLGVVINQDVVIGEGTVIQHHVTIGENRGKVPVIGKNVFIGAHAVIVGGVTVGDGSKIGCSSVVMHDVSPYTVVGGNPAKFIRYESHIR